MMEKRMRKVAGIEAAVPLPEMHGPRDAEVTLSAGAPPKA